MSDNNEATLLKAEEASELEGFFGDLLVNHSLNDSMEAIEQMWPELRGSAW